VWEATANAEAEVVLAAETSSMEAVVTRDSVVACVKDAED
jgi:hypothetical protein